MWDKMSAFFNANPPDVRVQPHVDTDTRINLDDFLTGSIFSNGKFLDLKKKVFFHLTLLELVEKYRSQNLNTEET